MSVEDEIGPISLRLQAPALSGESYLDLQQNIWAELKPRSRWRIWRNMAIGLLGGLALGLIPAWLGWQGELWIAFSRLGYETYIANGALLAVTLLLALVPAALTLGGNTVRQVQALHRIHMQSGALFGEHEIVFGEQALLWRNAQRTTVIRWASFNALRRGRQQWLLIADHASAIWLSDAAVATGPGEAEVLAQIARYTGLMPAPKPGK